MEWRAFPIGILFEISLAQCVLHWIQFHPSSWLLKKDWFLTLPLKTWGNGNCQRISWASVCTWLVGFSFHACTVSNMRRTLSDALLVTIFHVTQSFTSSCLLWRDVDAIKTQYLCGVLFAMMAHTRRGRCYENSLPIASLVAIFRWNRLVSMECWRFVTQNSEFGYFPFTSARTTLKALRLQTSAQTSLIARVFAGVLWHLRGMTASTWGSMGSRYMISLIEWSLWSEMHL